MDNFYNNNYTYTTSITGGTYYYVPKEPTWTTTDWTTTAADSTITYTYEYKDYVKYFDYSKYMKDVYKNGYKYFESIDPKIVVSRLSLKHFFEC